VSSCPENYIDPPSCTKCAANYENKDGKCLEIKSKFCFELKQFNCSCNYYSGESKPSGGAGRRIFLILLASLLTIAVIVAMLFVYGRLNQQRRRRSSANPGNISDSSNSNTHNRFNNILRSIGLNNLNKRGRFNFFSISNNNNSSG